MGNHDILTFTVIVKINFVDENMRSKNELRAMFLEVLYEIQYGNSKGLSHGLDSIIPEWINRRYKVKLDRNELITINEIVQELKTQGYIVRDPGQSENFILLTQKGKKFYESGSTTVPTIPFEQMNFHPIISKSSQSLYESGHYNLAIFEAFKAVNNFVKNKSERSDLDGKNLMSTCFSTKSPILKLNNMNTESEINEQEGFMFLFMGAMQGIRNPLAHDEVYIQADLAKTLEYLTFASLLIRKVEEAKKI